jgi:hypothetical protein
MSNEQIQIDELVLDAYLVPSLDAAAQAWYEVRQRFQNSPVGQNRDAYNKATFELGLRFSELNSQLPEFFEQLRFWLNSHPEDRPQQQ